MAGGRERLDGGGCGCVRAGGCGGTCVGGCGGGESGGWGGWRVRLRERRRARRRVRCCMLRRMWQRVGRRAGERWVEWRVGWRECVGAQAYTLNYLYASLALVALAVMVGLCVVKRGCGRGLCWCWPEPRAARPGEGGRKGSRGDARSASSSDVSVGAPWGGGEGVGAS